MGFRKQGKGAFISREQRRYLGCTAEAPEIRYLNITVLRHFTEEYVLALFL